MTDYTYTVKWYRRGSTYGHHSTYDSIVDASHCFKSELWDNVCVIVTRSDDKLMAKFDRYSNGNVLFVDDPLFNIDFDVSLLDD